MSDFRPAFDTPSTLEQAIAVIQAWGKPSVMTFDHRRADQCARILSDALTSGRIEPTIAPVLAEVERATRKFPTWPTDPLHALAVLGEEFGELTKAALQTVYEPHKVKPGELRTEAIQTAAMALRFLASLDAYRFKRSEQHQQPEPRQPAQAVPLSREQIVRIYETPELAGSYFEDGTEKAVAVARAVERACAEAWGVKLAGGGEGA